MSYIEVKNISKTYKTGNIDVEAVKGVSFEVEKGEEIGRAHV